MTNGSKHGRRTLALGFGALLLTASMQAVAAAPPGTVGMGPEPVAQKTYATPEDAVGALVDAARNDRLDDLAQILGPHAGKLIRSGDPVADNNGRERFTAAYDKAHKLEADGNNREVLTVGAEQWPMPIPLVKDPASGAWRFDTAAGEQEILNRRIGRNELNVINVCRAYVEAQRDFAALHPLAGGRHQYAVRFVSAPGWHDGLYWPAQEGQPESPLGPFMAQAAAEGYSRASGLERTPYHGYYYRILSRQGPHAAGGAEDYVSGGLMTRGFALVAFPAEYGNSGVMTFIVNQNGIVYQKNLGPSSAEVASTMATYDPDESWTVVP